ncbi:MAG: hypothetical protein OEO20_01130 [Gemmatimonadota bacterium]|nr:hypothetical protein [Gemmatimonadota bacterium]MDH3367133.1 hypothetical protein [Gemmatimonadota bacterium]MDH3476891.1 hypothetical protein [Gemmatimonadota bacterium]MDH3569101.1 hypothetical protein [Gemmatimonadota bacterium]MDH5548305.1 hypothetical protein [Gemmatimonadota bacterium]
MNKRMALVTGSLLALVLACVGDEEQPPPQPLPVEGQSTAPDSIVMPAFPASRRGYLVARSSGVYELSGEWPARAGMCEDPAVMEVLAQQPGVGTIVLLRLPPPPERLAIYPIAIVDSGAPPPPAAQIGVQLFQGANAYAFQGLEGQVVLTGMSDRVSGRYEVTLREISSNGLAKYAGVFESVMLETLPDAQCDEWKRELLPTDSVTGDN